MELETDQPRTKPDETDRKKRQWIGDPSAYGLKEAPATYGVFDRVVAAKRAIEAIVGFDDVRLKLQNGISPTQIMKVIPRTWRSDTTMTAYLTLYRRYVMGVIVLPGVIHIPPPPVAAPGPPQSAPPAQTAVVAQPPRSPEGWMPTGTDKEHELIEMERVLALYSRRVDDYLQIQELTGIPLPMMRSELKNYFDMTDRVLERKMDLGYYRRARTGMDLTLNEGRRGDGPPPPDYSKMSEEKRRLAFERIQRLLNPKETETVPV